MKTSLLLIGKTTPAYLQSAIDDYASRLPHYSPFEIVVLPDVKNPKALTTEQLKQREGEAFLAKLNTDDYLVLLDDKGSEYTSPDFAAFIQQRANSGIRRLVFIIGGAFGFSQDLYARANHKLSLSRLTFSHQLVRPIFLEQLYRAQTILHNEPYHHE